MHINIFWDSLAPEGLQVPVARAISAISGIPATVTDNPVRLMGYNNGRRQLDAAALLDNASAYRRRHQISDPLIIVVSQDLYSPVHSFVFGLAREPAGVAVVSSARLRNEYYDRLPSDDDLIDRLVKEGAHEIGHLFGLSHCADPQCIMFRPDTLAELDGKKKIFCERCRGALESGQAAPDQ